MEELLHDGATLVRNPKKTIDPARSSHEQASTDAARSESARIEILSTLGEGGMGIVHLGRQVTLGREVAVKTVRAEVLSEANTSRLLREAWITGALEHPNVVPVHDIALDETGQPRIVMKKIDGKPWSDLFWDERTVKQRFKVKSLLNWNVRILMQVCDAIRFAHSRGILHRDIKPENVMIGEFGEVYVVDWGLAVSMVDDGTNRLPLAKDATDMAGTPCYMAPEMLGGHIANISERTDVYLLGATLFELATGAPPHDGASLEKVIASIVRTPPLIPATVPKELARIITRALDADPDGRFENAEQLRLALMSYIEHTGSIELAEEAMERLRELELERRTPGLDPDELRLRLYNLYGECRFGFLQALRVWRDNEVAAEGLRTAAMFMIDLELSQGDVKAAAVHLLEIKDPSPSLVLRVEEAKRAYELEQQELAALRGQIDVGVGRRTRLFAGMLMGLFWTLWPLITQFRVTRFGVELTHRQLALGALGMGVFASIIGIWGRESLTRTLTNRRLMAAVTVVIVAQFSLYVGAGIAGIDVATTHVLAIFLWGVVSGMVATNIEARLVFTTVGFFIAFFIAAARAEWVYYCMSLSNLVLTLNLGLVWGRVQEDVLDPLRQRREQRKRELERFLERRRVARVLVSEPPPERDTATPS